MTVLSAQITFFQVFEQWKPSYPGDFMVRPKTYVYDVRYNDRDLFSQWLKDHAPAYTSELGAPYPHTIDNKYFSTFGVGWVQFDNKRNALMFEIKFR